MAQRAFARGKIGESCGDGTYLCHSDIKKKSIESHTCTHTHTHTQTHTHTEAEHSLSTGCGPALIRDWERVDKQCHLRLTLHSFHLQQLIVTQRRCCCCLITKLCLVWLFVTPWIITCQNPLSSTISQSLLKCMSIESVIISNHLICRPLLP